MGRRYYCDYCNRSFLDDINSRKKHLNSNIHIRNRKAHYAQWRDLKTLLVEESQKLECKRFKNGQCNLGDNCNFTHYSSLDLKMITAEVERGKDRSEEIENMPSVEDWLQKRNKTDVSTLSPQLQPPPILPFMYDPASLPPSMRPLSIQDVQRMEKFESWG